ncbi:site-specific integrase [Oscillibacter hominis]|uniref:Site-specific integrase n=1 Tax=Oscillibacter hominis TaxID=2763056 RepID=A0A7G9B6G5_9FIRM|nr:site-specific integrase [Oscillibacter hominis]QNL45146.1 site-specific integrase [Oscillibacter hominis]
MAKRRPSGDGMVRKRDDGRWEGRIVVGHKENGDSIFRYVYADTQKELTAKLRKHITAYQGADLSEQSSMTLVEWLELWLEDVAGTIRPNTLNRYRGTIKNHIKPQLGQKVISQITPKDIQKFYDRLLTCGNLNSGEGLSNNTVRGIHGMLHEALDAAKQARLIIRNPTEDAMPPKFSQTPKRILTDEQLDIFMDAIKEDDVWHDFFYTELMTGLRRGELCGLMWDDFDEVDGTLRIRRTVRREKATGLITGDTKTYAGTRNIVLPPSVIELLKERKEKALTEWIFPDPIRPERPTDPGTAYNRLKTLLKQAGLPSIRFHDLRHTFATHALASGVDIKTLSGILGHTRTAFTLDTYAHTTGDMQKRAAEIVGKFMTDIFGEELKPWEESAKAGMAPSA